MSLVQITEYQPDKYLDAHIDIDFRHRQVKLDATELALTRKEYDLLAVLAQNAGEVVLRETLLLRIWGYSTEIRTRTLDVHIRRLRRKLGSYSERYIETIFGMGYRFQPYRAQRRVLGSALAVTA
jgi:DNA-binding response OmpR family regulator